MARSDRASGAIGPRRTTYLRLAALSGVAALGLAACSSGDGSSSPSASGGETITVGVEAGAPAPEFYKSIADRFTQETGITVKFVDVPGTSMHETFVTDAVSASGGFDVYDLDGPWIPEFASKGFLEPLSTALADEDRADFYPAAIDSVTYDGEVYGLPWLVHGPILYYRTDLFEQAGIDGPPTTTDELRADAATLTDPATGVYGTIVEGKQIAEAVSQLYDTLLQFDGNLLDDDLTVTADSPEVKAAFDWMLGLQYDDQSSPPGAVDYDNGDVANMFLQGQVAMVKNWPYMYAMAKDPAQSTVSDSFAVAAQPVTNAVWSWSFGVAAGSTHKDAATRFVQWATSTDVLAELGTATINPVPRSSAWDQVKASEELTDQDKDALAVMTQAVDQGQAVPMGPNFAAFRDRMAVVLSSIMTRQQTPDEALSSAQPELQSIVDGS